MVYIKKPTHSIPLVFGNSEVHPIKSKFFKRSIRGRTKDGTIIDDFGFWDSTNRDKMSFDESKEKDQQKLYLFLTHNQFKAVKDHTNAFISAEILPNGEIKDVELLINDNSVNETFFLKPIHGAEKDLKNIHKYIENLPLVHPDALKEYNNRMMDDLVKCTTCGRLVSEYGEFCSNPCHTGIKG